MNAGLPSTFFTQPPHWRWLIIAYFFVGGLAGGCYFLAALLDLLGAPHDRRLARWGYYVAFPAIVLSGLILTVDLGRPERFWHMLLQSATWRPMFKSWSPISVGAWALLVFGGFSALAFLSALAEAGRLRWPWLLALRPPGALGTILTVLGAIGGLFVAGYTGVLLAVTNRPIWADTPLLGLVFLISATSTSIALLVLLGGRWAWAASSLRALVRMDSVVLVMEVVAIVALIASLGSLARLWLSGWGVLLVLGVIVLGDLVPLALLWRPQWAGRYRSEPVAAVLVLIGGFLLRVAIVMVSEGFGRT
jgi:formate-dependent nitrite reductase membrane component NrfD